MQNHPLQAALDRATNASYAAIDLLDIAADRGRDRRQSFLFRASIAASMGILEEYFEAAPPAFLSGNRLPAGLIGFIQSHASRLQSTGTSNLCKALVQFGLRSPKDSWQANLVVNEVRPDFATRQTGQAVRLEILGLPNGGKTFSGGDISWLVDAFTFMRHSFAHQDSSRTPFTARDIEELAQISRTVPGIKLREVDEGTSVPWTHEEFQLFIIDDKHRDFIERLSAVCTVQLMPNSNPENVLLRWAVHQRHAANSIRLAVGIVATVTAALADQLECEMDIRRDRYNPLSFRVQSGAWNGESSPSELAAGGVPVVLGKYAPNSR